MTQRLKRNVFIIALVLVVIMVLVMMKLVPKGGADVVITQDGKIYGKYPLATNQVITIENDFGKNVVEIKDGKVRMMSADCPNQICVHTQAITVESPFPIVCMPHQLIVELQ